MPAAHPVAVKLDAEIHARMRQLAKAQHRPPHYLMREAIAQYVEREDKREAFRHHSYVSLRADHVIVGRGVQGYVEGIEWALGQI